jgi:hypothetical protein
VARRATCRRMGRRKAWPVACVAQVATWYIKLVDDERSRRHARTSGASHSERHVQPIYCTGHGEHWGMAAWVMDGRMR